MADSRPDKIVRIAPDRWQSLVEHVHARYAHRAEVLLADEIAVYEPTLIGGILYLPALYRAA